MNGKSWPYLAALVDGEGSIAIGRSQSRGRPEYSLHTPVNNTCYPLMLWLRQHFGGNIRSNSKTIYTKRPCYCWGNYGHAAQREILEAIKPYLVIKRGQAEVALEYLGLHGDRDSRDEREALWLKMKDLNGREQNFSVPARYKEVDEYLAGILDGEGSLCISRPVNAASRLDFRVSNSSPYLVNWLKDVFGGRVNFRPTRAFRDEYVWFPSGKANKERLLLQLIPHLIVKKEQAKLALQYLRTGDASLADSITALNNGLSPTANTQDASQEAKIESDLHGDVQCASAVTQTS